MWSLWFIQPISLIKVHQGADETVLCTSATQSNYRGDGRTDSEMKEGTLEKGIINILPQSFKEV